METPPQTRKCKCGNTIGTPFVSPKSKYSIGGWILVSIGISHMPKEVVFSCDSCGGELKRITDKKVLKQHTYR